MQTGNFTYRLILIIGILASTIVNTTRASSIDCVDEQVCQQKVNALMKFARRGSPHAQILLAALYYEGDLVKQDFKKSFRLYQKAAKQRPLIALANYRLGLAYLDGKGPKKNNNKALKYFKKAADSSHLDAQVLIGMLYFEGKETKKDLQQAIHYLNLALKSNDSRAAYMLGLIAEYGLAGNKNIEEAHRLYAIAAKNNYPKALQKLNQNKALDTTEPKISKATKNSNIDNNLISDDADKGEVITIYANNMPVLEMMDIALANIKDMKVYSTQWTGSHLPGQGCGDGMTPCAILKDDLSIRNFMNGN